MNTMEKQSKVKVIRISGGWWWVAVDQGKWSHLEKVTLSSHSQVKELATWLSGERAFQEEEVVSAHALVAAHLEYQNNTGKKQVSDSSWDGMRGREEERQETNKGPSCQDLLSLWKDVSFSLSEMESQVEF